MAINRFYQPAQGQYVSQFVPTELPAELMMKVIASKQAVQDAGMKQRQMLGDWYMNAFGADDTAYVKSKQDNIRKWFDESANKEWASPEIQKGYQTLVRSINDDARLGRIQSVYDWNKEVEEAKKKLAEEGGHANAQEVYDEIDRRRARYAAPGSGGSEGEVQFLNMSPTKGVNIHSELLSMFTPLKADEWEAMRSIQSQLGNVYYNVANGGISLDKIHSVVYGNDDKIKDNMELILRSAAGQQLSKRFDMLHGFPDNEKIASMEIAKMSEEDQTEYLNKRARYVLDQAISIGQTVRQDTFKTGEAAARNTGWDREAENPLDQPLPTIINQESIENDYTTSSDNFTQNENTNKKAKEYLFAYNSFVNEYNSVKKTSPNITIDQFLENKRRVLGEANYQIAKAALNDPSFVSNQQKIIKETQLAMDDFNLRKDVAVAKSIGINADDASNAIQTINGILNNDTDNAKVGLEYLMSSVEDPEMFLGILSGRNSPRLTVNLTKAGIAEKDYYGNEDNFDTFAKKGFNTMGGLRNQSVPGLWEWRDDRNTYKPSKNAQTNLENWIGSNKKAYYAAFGKARSEEMFDAIRYKVKLKLASASNTADSWVEKAVKAKLNIPSSDDIRKMKIDLGIPDNYETYQKDIEKNFNDGTGTRVNEGITATPNDVKKIWLADGTPVYPVDHDLRDMVRESKHQNFQSITTTAGRHVGKVDWSTFEYGGMDSKIDERDGTLLIRGTVKPIITTLDKNSLSGTSQKQGVEPLQIVLKVNKQTAPAYLARKRQELIPAVEQGNQTALKFLVNGVIPRENKVATEKIIDGVPNQRIVLDDGSDEVIVAFKPKGPSSLYYVRSVNKSDLNNLTIENSSMFDPKSSLYERDRIDQYTLLKPEQIIWKYMEGLKLNNRIPYNPLSDEDIKNNVLR